MRPSAIGLGPEESYGGNMGIIKPETQFDFVGNLAFPSQILLEVYPCSKKNGLKSF
jgi:hypothetical protein